MMNASKRWILGLCGLCALATALPMQAFADSFRNGDLFVGQPVKQSSEDRRFAFGVGFSIAPVKAIIKSQVNKQLDGYAAENPEAAVLKEYIQYADTEQMRALADSGKLEEFKAALKAEMEKNGVQLSAEQQAAIDGIDEGKLRLMADMIEIAQEPDDTLTFAIEPWAAVNFEYLQIKTMIAIAGYNNDSGTTLQIGNLGLQLSTGSRLGPVGKRFGWTLGVRGWVPTATVDANAMALANIMNTPNFLHQYATISPFAVLGLDFSLIQWTLRAEYVHMLAVRQDDVKVDDMAYVQAGTGVLLSLRWIGVSVELDGLFEVNNAIAMRNTFLLTTGVRGYLGPVGIGAGVQVPIVPPGSKESRGIEFGGVAAGNPADINFLVQARMQF